MVWTQITSTHTNMKQSDEARKDLGLFMGKGTHIVPMFIQSSKSKYMVSEN